MMQRTFTTLFALVCLSQAATAHADRAAEARFHDEQARRYYASRRYEDAVRSFMLEQRLSPNPNTVFNIALCMQQLRRHADAYMYYAEYLGSEETDETRRTQSERALRTLRPRVSLVRVQSEPAGAAIFVDRRELGQYGVTPRVLALDAGEHRIWVERQGYRPDEQTVALDLGGETSVTLHPAQILGRLRIGAATQASVRILDPGGAVIARGTTPFDQEIPPGTYQAEATSGDERWSEPIVVRAGQTSEAQASLIGPTGAATVTSNVTGALVSLDGSERGFTPQVLAAIPIGEHELRVSAQGMRTYSGTLSIEDDDHAWVTVDLADEGGSGVETITWIFGGVALAAALGAGVTTGFASDAARRFREARRMNMVAADIADESQALNITADALWISAGLLTITAVILLLTTSQFEAQPSRAMVTRESP